MKPLLVTALTLFSLNTFASDPVQKMDYVSFMNFGLHALSVQPMPESNEVHIIVKEALLSYGDQSFNDETITKLGELFQIEHLNAIRLVYPQESCRALDSELVEKGQLLVCNNLLQRQQVKAVGLSVDWDGVILEESDIEVEMAHAFIEIAQIRKLSASHIPDESFLQATVSAMIDQEGTRISIVGTKSHLDLQPQF